MARAAPPQRPAASAHRVLVVGGKADWFVSASAAMKRVPPAWASVVKWNALARRTACPPRKSLVPQVKTDPRLKVTDRDCEANGMEGLRLARATKLDLLCLIMDEMIATIERMGSCS